MTVNLSRSASSLRDRLRSTHSPDELDGAGRDYGMNGSLQRPFVPLLEEFDWPAQQTRLNQYPHLGSTSTDSGGTPCTPNQPDGAGLPLVLLHG